MTHTIREYDPARDADALRAMAVSLQDYLRRFDPDLRPGADMADAYLERIRERCAESNGCVFVAESPEGLIGYVYVLARIVSTEPEDWPRPYAYVHDLFVVEGKRSGGAGRALLARAERFARDAGATSVHLEVSSGNTGAIALYRELGFVERYRWLAKPLSEG